MQKLKFVVKPILYTLFTFIIYLIILVALHYTGCLKLSSIVKINFVVMVLVSLIMGVKAGKKTSKKGYLEGLKLGLIMILILFVINIIFYRSFSLYLLFYYLVILVSTTMGSMIGINIKR